MRSRTRRAILAGAPGAALALASPALAQSGLRVGDPGADAAELRALLDAAGALGAARAPEDYGAVGDGDGDDTEAILEWLRAPVAPKVAPPGRVYRITRPLDLIDAGPFDADFTGSMLRLEHTEPIYNDGIAVYGLYLPARHALRNVVIEGLGREAMQSGIVTPSEPGDILWENVWFRNFQRRAFHMRTDNFTGLGWIRITDSQTFPGPLPERYQEGAGRFNCRNFTIDKLWGEGGSKRCFAFVDPEQRTTRDAVESGHVAHVYVPRWETLGYSGQALYCNYANNVTFGRVDVLDYYCDVSSAAVYFSRDCRDVTVLSAYVSARGHPLATALGIGGGKRVRVLNAFLRAEGRVLRIEGHRHNYYADDITVEGVFHCHIPEGVTLVEPPILLRDNLLGDGEGRDLRGATIRGKLVLTGPGTIVPPSDRSENSARGAFLMVDSTTGTVLLDGIEMDTGGRPDVIPIGIGSTGSVAKVVIRNLRTRTGDRWCLAAWKGAVHVQGGSTEQEAHRGDVQSAIWAPAETSAVYRIQGFDAGESNILLTNGAGHVVTNCIAARVEVPPDGIAAYNVTLEPD